MKKLQTLGVIAGIALAGLGVAQFTNETAPVNASTERVERIHHNADWVKVDEDEDGWVRLGRLARESKGDKYHVKLVQIVAIEDGQIIRDYGMSIRCRAKTISYRADGNHVPVAKGTMSEAIYDAFCL